MFHIYKNIIYSTITLLIFFSSSNAQLRLQSFPFPKINDSIYIDETEVTIKDWITFLSDNAYYKTIDIKELLPDTNKIRKECRKYFYPFFNKEKLSFKIEEHSYRSQPQQFCFPVIINDSFQDTLFQNGVPMSELPITGITYDQAQLYCKWRTDKLNKILSAKKEAFPLKLRNKKMVVRLFSPEEFIYYSKLYGYKEKRRIRPRDFKENLKIDTLIPGKNCITFLYKIDESYKNAPSDFDNGPYPVGTFFSEFLTIYNWFGNVAEMTSQVGLAKGGSFRHYGKEAFPINNLLYSGSQDWLGFRCLIEAK